MADEKKIHPWPVQFKDEGSVIRLNGQEIHSGNLTQDLYESLLAWSKDFALQFVPYVKKERKPKAVKPDGKATKEASGAKSGPDA